jgi:hypothetical protein
VNKSNITRIENPEGEILNILEDTSPLIWRRYQARISQVWVQNHWERRDRSDRPPYVSFRFENEDEDLIRIIKEAVNSFDGNLKWVINEHKRIDLPGTNRSITPSRFAEVREIATQSKMSADDYLAKYEPELGPLAYDDLPRLAEHIRKEISEKYQKSMPRS